MSVPYRVLLTGSRGWKADNPTHVALIHGVLKTLLRELHPDGRPKLEDRPVLVHGHAIGADRIADRYWTSQLLPVERHPVSAAQWQAKGRAAGLLRSQHMVELGADVCVAFLLNESKGASYCAEYAESCGIRTVRVERTSADLSEPAEATP